ncbi:hypothetical protein M3Y14_32705 (plasmid) [Bacillus thuringiensis]|uniref:hypothetical protein n=1 Tax=Bacillus thuringiensis TaxID=1428 RepID=UPI0022251A4C|nr:hypothetical protein [Bacillus thuringiensis]UYX55678.1 hypothetical protein M3Y14_30785 [Bacillus thuringiensis]UYX55798.1 hypothetical protein M3Y14_32705 [Bacillus thuringiensis]
MDKIHEVEMLEKKRKSSLRQTTLTIALVLILAIVIEYFSFFANLFGVIGIEGFLKFLLQIIFLGLGMVSVCNLIIHLTIAHQLDKKRDDIKPSKTLL